MDSGDDLALAAAGVDTEPGGGGGGGCVSRRQLSDMQHDVTGPGGGSGSGVGQTRPDAATRRDGRTQTDGLGRVRSAESSRVMTDEPRRVQRWTKTDGRRRTCRVPDAGRDTHRGGQTANGTSCGLVCRLVGWRAPPQSRQPGTGGGGDGDERGGYDLMTLIEDQTVTQLHTQAHTTGYDLA